MAGLPLPTAAVDGQVLTYIHKEQALADVKRRFPARHDVLIDDKPRILAAVKQRWLQRVTTILPRQGQYTQAAEATAVQPPPDHRIEQSAALLAHDAPGLTPPGEEHP
jgi:hypothetical protein